MPTQDRTARRAGTSAPTRALGWALIAGTLAATLPAAAAAGLPPMAFRDIGFDRGAHFRGGASFDYEAVSARFAADVAWTRAPTWAETVAAYPAKAREHKAGGHATLDCAFTATGELTACVVAHEDAPGLGFGAAALALAPRFAAPALLADGRKAEGVGVQVEFAFAPEMLDPGEPEIGQPEWTALPSVEDFTAALPADAARAGVDATVVLACQVEAGGTLSGCKVDSQEPAGAALGQAALLLAPKFRVKVWSDEGLPLTGGALRAPIRVKIDEAPGK